MNRISIIDNCKCTGKDHNAHLIEHGSGMLLCTKCHRAIATLYTVSVNGFSCAIKLPQVDESQDERKDD